MRGKFSNVIDNIRKINELKRRYSSPFPELHWKFIVFGHNEHELPVAREMARELGMSFSVELNYAPDYSPVRDLEAVRAATGTGAATYDEYEALHGHSYYSAGRSHPICDQLWDEPQINWDGKVLGCGCNFWGDFGGNAFRDGLTASVNTEQIQYARAMLLGRAPPRKDIPCTQCYYYKRMRKLGRWVERGDRPALKEIYFAAWVAYWLVYGIESVYHRARPWVPKWLDAAVKRRAVSLPFR